MRLKIYTLLISLFISMACLHAQNYLISFEGSGAISTVDSVKVENITQGTNLTMSGTDVLHLKGIISGTLPNFIDPKREISFSPNPMTDYSLMRFILPESGKTEISLIDLTGKKLIQEEDFLSKGQHTYRIYGIDKGFYIITVRCGRYLYSGRLICSGSLNSSAKIVYENTISIQEKHGNTETVMQYTTGDRIKFTGISGIYSALIVDVPAESKTIKFIFFTCTDADGNNYPVVQIGNQLWMAGNLKTTRYKNTTPIPNVTDDSEWAGLITPAYCWYNNNIGNKDVYGALYNWYVVKTGNLCPEGWHVPIDAEWHQLALFLDPNAVLSIAESEIAGNKLKEEGTTHWSPPNTSATNETGFTALPGGYRKYDGAFYGPTGNGNWRTATECDATHVLYRYIFYHSSCLYRDITNMQAGYSVRCVKD